MLRKPIAAALFDMDGLLLDTEAIYIEAIQVAARALGYPDMPLDLCHSTAGVTGPVRNRMIEAHYGEGFDVDAFRGHFSVHVRRQTEAGIPLKPGVVELLDFLDGRGLPLAVATSARRPTAENHLGKAGLLERFKAVVTRDDVERTKPHPDVYLEAARRLAAAPEHCVAFEDSNVGLEAAYAAGTMAFMVPDLVQPLPESHARCLQVVPDLHAALRLLREQL
jgi:HAD superfamily hydrolase (TIGR01509 family)